jgi:hypothetical protein
LGGDIEELNRTEQNRTERAEKLGIWFLNHRNSERGKFSQFKYHKVEVYLWKNTGKNFLMQQKKNFILQILSQSGVYG